MNFQTIQKMRYHTILPAGWFHIGCIFEGTNLSAILITFLYKNAISEKKNLESYWQLSNFYSILEEE